MSQRSLKFEDSGFTHSEWKVLSKLSTPAKIQDFLNRIHFNHELGGETYQSVRRVLRSKKAHCLEGALLAAAALWIKGEKPLLLDLVTSNNDDDHVVVLFKRGKYWGAISKTNHLVLRYREPIYRDVRELAMSYFHEYFLSDGTKTLRSYSKPFDLSKIGLSWLVSDEDLFWLVNKLHHSPHEKLISKSAIQNLRKADLVERKALNTVEYPKTRARRQKQK